jgi:hypothetical protein
VLLSELLIAKNHAMSYAEEAAIVRRAFWSRGGCEKARFFPYAMKRFLEGWPNRKAPARVNAPQFLAAFKILLGLDQGRESKPSMP